MITRKLEALEVLEKLQTEIPDEIFYTFERKDCFLIIKQALGEYYSVCEMNKRLNKDIYDLASENLELRIKLKEKQQQQQPMKVELVADGEYDGEDIYDTALCPNCGRDFEVEYEEHYKYCPTCGQRLDWKEAELEDE